MLKTYFDLWLNSFLLIRFINLNIVINDFNNNIALFQIRNFLPNRSIVLLGVDVIRHITDFIVLIIHSLKYYLFRKENL